MLSYMFLDSFTTSMCTHLIIYLYKKGGHRSPNFFKNKLEVTLMCVFPKQLINCVKSRSSMAYSAEIYIKLIIWFLNAFNNDI